MHPVISNLLARQNKKVPVGDGRNLALVLFGGTMVGVRGAGALVALQELGLTGAFDQIYTMSSGFSNGTSFLAGQAHLTAAIYYQKLSGSRFLNFFRFWKIADVEYLLRVVRETAFDVEKILESRTKLYNMLVNVSKNGRHEHLEVHDYGAKEFFDLLRASLSVKYIAGGSVKIGDNVYHDSITGKAVTDFFSHVLSGGATDILVIYNYAWQRDHVRKNFPRLDAGRVYEICPDAGTARGGFLQKLSRFETRARVLKEHCRLSGNETKRIFGSLEPVTLI
jgi:predicted patatin/cPLA2 family phospholipase